MGRRLGRGVQANEMPGTAEVAGRTRSGVLQIGPRRPTVAETPLEGAFGPGGRDLSVLILPAIDLRGGRCVRLRQGDYAQETVFGDDPVAVARRWIEQGADRLHLVDLDGAKQGRPVNGDVIKAIIDASGVPCQLGGGLRTHTDLKQAFGWGVDRAILSTRALLDPIWFRSACEMHPGRIVLGLDAKHGKVATHGWLEVSERSAVELAKEAAGWP